LPDATPSAADEVEGADDDGPRDFGAELAAGKTI